MKTLDWIARGVNINGTRMIHLRFADTLIVVAESVPDLQSMLTELHEASLRVGLGMNMFKTKIMTIRPINIVNIIAGNDTVQVLSDCIYVGYLLTERLWLRSLKGVLVWVGWVNRMSVKTPAMAERKNKVYNQCVLPILTYGALNMRAQNKQFMHKIKNIKTAVALYVRHFPNRYRTAIIAAKIKRPMPSCKLIRCCERLF